MSISDIKMKEAIGMRLAGVQHRKEALQKFVTALDLEEQQLRALFKTYSDNRDLYDLIEAEAIEPLPEPTAFSTAVPQHVITIKPARTMPDMTGKGDMQAAILLCLEQYGPLKVNDLYPRVCELRPESRYDVMNGSLQKLVKQNKVRKIAHGTYEINK